MTAERRKCTLNGKKGGAGGGISLMEGRLRKTEGGERKNLNTHSERIEKSATLKGSHQK